MCQLFGAGVTGGKQSGKGRSPFGGDQVTVGFWHFADEPMGTKQAELAGDLSGMTAVEGLIIAEAVEAVAEVAVSDPMNAKLSSADRSEEVKVIFAEWIEPTDTLAIEAGRLA